MSFNGLVGCPFDKTLSGNSLIVPFAIVFVGQSLRFGGAHFRLSLRSFRLFRILRTCFEGEHENLSESDGFAVVHRTHSCYREKLLRPASAGAYVGVLSFTGRRLGSGVFAFGAASATEGRGGTRA